MTCASAELPRHERAIATVNPCTLCAPLGAVLATVGIEDAMPLLHGAQGCATYIRRYLISHFREPLDVASSSFTEASAVFGGENEFSRAIDNIRKQYEPELIAVGTTCLAETIGEDLRLIIDRYHESRGRHLPIVAASTPSYRDGHIEGFHAMTRALVEALVEERAPDSRPTDATTAAGPGSSVNLLAPIVSPADLRHLRELVESFTIHVALLPDYSDTLDAPISDGYRALPKGGTKLRDIRRMGFANTTLDLTMTGAAPKASDILQRRGVPTEQLGLPVGIKATDEFLEALKRCSGRAAPAWIDAERGRLLDAYADGHKYVYGKRVCVYGDPEVVVAVARFLLEIGARPVLCATGARNRALSLEVARLGLSGVEHILEDTDYTTIEAKCQQLGVDLLIGGSKGYRTARTLGVPLLRMGFPIHDRIGAGRLLTVGYRGTVALFDSVVNTLLEVTQNKSPIGFSYL